MASSRSEVSISNIVGAPTIESQVEKGKAELSFDENIMSQVSKQWKSWKKNIRQCYFGKTRQEILEWKDKVLAGEQVSIAKWNVIIEREAAPQKLEQRAKA
ncbi:hypothetical protein LguiA_013330 [Lonicera macranthoides]